MRRGQSTVESMLLVAVVVVGLALAAYAFVPGFQAGVRGLGDDMDTLFSQAEQDGSGDRR